MGYKYLHLLNYDWKLLNGINWMFNAYFGNLLVVCGISLLGRFFPGFTEFFPPLKVFPGKNWGKGREVFPCQPCSFIGNTLACLHRCLTYHSSAAVAGAEHADAELLVLRDAPQGHLLLAVRLAIRPLRRRQHPVGALWRQHHRIDRGAPLFMFSVWCLHD